MNEEEKCEKRGSRAALVSGWFRYDPDDEPYQSGVEEESPAKGGEIWLGAWKCDVCGHIQGLFTE